MIHLIVQLVRLLWRSSGDKHHLAEKEAVRRVRVLDAATNTVKKVPESALQPGMVEAEIPGAGLVWVMAGALKRDGQEHPPFTSEEFEKVAGVKEALDEVNPQSLEQWEEMLRRFAFPQAELARWSVIANVYTLCTRGRGLSQAARRDYYNVTVASSVSARERVLELVDLQAVPPAEAQEAVSLYFNHRG